MNVRFARVQARHSDEHRGAIHLRRESAQPQRSESAIFTVTIAPAEARMS
jgi:hypothetical protein